MQLIEVDRLDAQATEGRVQRTMEVAPRQSNRIGVLAALSTGAPLAGEDDPVSDVSMSCGEPAPDDLFRDAANIHIGGVDQIAASLNECVEDCESVLLRRLGAEIHSSKSNPGHRDSSVTELAIQHGNGPSNGRLGSV